MRVGNVSYSLSKDQVRILKWMLTHMEWKSPTEIGNTVGGWSKGME